MTRKLTPEEIELEFDEPLADIIIGMREQGCILEEIAGVFGMSRPQLYLWRQKLGLGLEKRARFDVASRVDARARALGWRDASDAIREMRWDGMTVAQVAQKLSCSPRTVTRHYPLGLAGEVFVKTKRYIETRQIHRKSGNWSG